MAKTQSKSTIIQELKNKPAGEITRDEIAALLKSIGKPGEHQQAKINAVSEVGLSTTSQGFSVEDTLHSYKEF